MDLTEQPDRAVLRRFGYEDPPLLGRGGEGAVYKIDENRIFKLYHPNCLRSDLDGHVCLINEINKASEGVTFCTPYVHEVVEVGNRIGTIETFYPGDPLTKVIDETKNSDEEKQLILGWLDASYEVGSIDIERNAYGDLHKASESSNIFREYWIKRLEGSLEKRGGLYKSVDLRSIVNSMPEPEKPALVHLDLFAGNLLWYEQRVSAIIDFGSATIMGDVRLNALFSAVFILSIPKLDNEVNHKLVHGWLVAHGLNEWYKPSQKMLAALWSFVDDNDALDRWCKSILL